MNRPVTELPAALVAERGAVVSSADCSAAEIAQAAACNRLFVDADGLGFVLRVRAWRELAERRIHDFVVEVDNGVSSCRSQMTVIDLREGEG